MFKFSVISPSATYQLNTSVSPVDEGQSSTVTLTTTGVQLGQAIPYTISGVGITADDISGDALSGNFVVDSTGTATKTLNIAADLTTEGSETLTMSLGNGTNVSLTINDTSLTPVAGDMYYDNIALLMHMDGADNGTVLTDEKGHTITRNAVVTKTAVNKFGTASAYFNGASNMNVSGTGTDFVFGVNDFTVEFWIYPTVASGYIMDFRPASTNGLYPSIIIHPTTHKFMMWTNAGAFSIASTTVAQINTWYHVAFVRVSGVLKVFVNGVLENSIADTTNYLCGANRPMMGVDSFTTNSDYFSGYLDDVRITPIVARFSNTFTVPTQAYPNTKNENVDPFWNNVSVMSHFDNSFADTKGNTLTGTAGFTTTAKFGSHALQFGASTNNYVSVPASLFNFGTGDFTFEIWTYGVGNHCFVVDGRGGTGTGKITARATSGGDVSWMVDSVTLGSFGVPAAGQWTHLAVSRSGGITRCFKNGVLSSSFADTTNYTSNNTTGVMLGHYFVAGSFNQYTHTGYMDEMRVTVGAGRYITNFTPPSRSFAETA